MIRILFDERWKGPHGIGRFAVALGETLPRSFDIVALRRGPRPSGPIDFLWTAFQSRRHRCSLFVSAGYNGSPLLGRHQIFMVHDLIHLDPRGPKLRQFINKLFYNTLYRSAAKRAVRVVTVTQASAADIGALWPETRRKLRVISPGVSDAFIASRHVADRTGLIVFGNLRWHKNLAGMLQAYANIGAPERLSIVGGRTEKLEELISDLGLGTNIIWRTNLGDSELAELYHQSKALLFCSFLEGYGIPIAEAMACGCRVVTSDLPVLRETGGSYCHYVNPSSVESMAIGIKAALRPPDLAGPGVSPPEPRNWHQVSDDFVALIKEASADLGL